MDPRTLLGKILSHKSFGTCFVRNLDPQSGNLLVQDSKGNISVAPYTEFVDSNGNKLIGYTFGVSIPFGTPLGAAPGGASMQHLVTITRVPTPQPKVSMGDVCPKCGAEVKERLLLNSKFVGCLC